MNIEKRLKQWVDARLIEPSQGEAILRYERERPSMSWVLFGISALGVLVLFTGIVSILAANWSEIPASAKLTGYFLSLAALGYATWSRSSEDGVLRESLLLAFACYVLAGIGLVGQTYNLQSDGYSAGVFWLIAVLPLTLLSRGRALSNLWFLGLTVTVLLWLISGSGMLYEEALLNQAFITMALPYILLAIGYGLAHVLSEPFAHAARLWGYEVILVPYSIAANIAWHYERVIPDVRPFGYRPIIPALALVIAIGAVCLRRIQPGKYLTYAICMTLAVSGALLITPTVLDLGGHPVLGCALFILVWCGAAAIAAANERRRLFDIAAHVIGLRFIVLYFQVFGSLAATGIGLILSGFVILGIASLWHSYRGLVAKAIQERL